MLLFPEIGVVSSLCKTQKCLSARKKRRRRRKRRRWNLNRSFCFSSTEKQEMERGDNLASVTLTYLTRETTHGGPSRARAYYLSRCYTTPARRVPLLPFRISERSASRPKEPFSARGERRGEEREPRTFRVGRAATRRGRKSRSRLLTRGECAVRKAELKGAPLLCTLNLVANFAPGALITYPTMRCDYDLQSGTHSVSALGGSDKGSCSCALNLYTVACGAQFIRCSIK